MPKALCIFGSVVAVSLVLIFGVDLALKFPFGRVSWLADVGFVVCSAVLGYLSWTSLREQS